MLILLLPLILLARALSISLYQPTLLSKSSKTLLARRRSVRSVAHLGARDNRFRSSSCLPIRLGLCMLGTAGVQPLALLSVACYKKRRALAFIVNIMSMMLVGKWIFWPPVFGCVTWKLAAQQLVSSLAMAIEVLTYSTIAAQLKVCVLAMQVC